MSRISRRRFVQTAVAASTAFPLFTIAGTKASGKVIGANDTIHVGVAGINGRGGSHISAFTSMGDKVQVTCLIDPDSSLFESRARGVADRTNGKRPAVFQDIRQALEDKDLDAVTVATCNHWHSLITIWACQAGKDVYVEKPISHNIFEGRKCVEAAKKYGRVVQHGTQSRSEQNWANEVAAVHSGKYGQLLVSKGASSKAGKGRWSIGYQMPQAPPSTLDWNIWQGPAQEQPFNKNLHPYNWHWFWATGNGEIGNQGVHQMDIARWGIKGGTLPTKVYSVGGRFLFDGDANGKDQAQTPNMQLAVMEYGPVKLLFEVRGLVDKDKQKFPQDVSNKFYTTEGMITRGKFYPKNGGAAEPIKVENAPQVAKGGAFGAFINAMRSRKPEDNNCDAETAHYSAAAIHVANASYRLGKPGTYDQARGAIGDNKEVVASLEMINENCKGTGVPMNSMTYTIGPVLTFDPATEKFTGEYAEAANKLITRDYRKPFVVPEQV